MVRQNQPQQDLVSVLMRHAGDSGMTFVEYVKIQARDRKPDLGPDGFDARNVVSALRGETDVAEMTNSEHAVWLECFCENMASPGPAEVDFFDKRKRAGLGCGLNQVRMLVRADQGPVL